MPTVRIHVVDQEFMEANAPTKVLKMMSISSPQEATRLRNLELVKLFKGREVQDWDIFADLEEKDPKARAKHMIGQRTLLDHTNRQAKGFDRAVVRISVSCQESILWISDRPFTVVEVARDEHDEPQNPRAPDNPFHRCFPARSLRDKRRNRKVRDWYLGSGPARPEAANQRYKVTFEIGGKVVDPDFVCGD